MTTIDADTGLAIVCDSNGALARVIRNEISAPDHLKAGRQFVLLLDRASYTKGLGFMAELQAKGAAFDWEMNIPSKNGVVTLHFAGSEIDDAEHHLLIVGARTRAEILQLYDELMRINNEQTNVIRQSIKRQVEATQKYAERDHALYDEISRLNNELISMQRELAKKNVELQRLNEEKNQFLGMAAHDLRTPLAAIVAYSEFLAQDLTGIANEEQREFLDIIQSSSVFMAQLVSDLLDIAQVEAGVLRLALQPVNLAELARRAVTRANLLSARKQITISLLAEDLPPLTVDAIRIEQVLDNLISNAVKFSHPGSPVTVRLASQPEEVLLSVADQGQGIPARELDRVFKPFARTSVKSTAGEKDTGLGLAIVRKIVLSHRGRIWVESEPGRGTTFHVALPIKSVA